MMECYQKCVDIGKRCSFVGSTGSCTDCGKICGSILTTSSQNCRCNAKSSTTTPCQNRTTGCDKQQQQQQQHQNTAPDAQRDEAGRQTPEKQSFWQWLLSLVGLRGKKDQRSQETTSLKYDNLKPLTGKSHKPIETFSPQAILAEAKDICHEIKKHKPDLYVKSEQSSPPAPPSRDEVTDNITQTSPSPESKRKRNGKRKTPPSTPGRDKYLGKPLESTPKKGSSPGKKSPRSNSHSPRREKESNSKTQDESSGASEEILTSGEKRPPTSPIYSSERYLKPYQTEVCPRNLSCQECSLCSPDPSPSSRKGKNRCQRSPRSITKSASCTMPCALCPCPICCPQPCCSQPCCPQPCCPQPCCPGSCRQKLCMSCSSCCCRTELQKKDMKKRRGSVSPCGRGSPQTRDKRSKRSKHRSSSCPSSPTPCCPPCRSPICRAPPGYCPAPRPSITKGKAKFSCMSLCPAPPIIRPCPPPLCPLIPRIPKSISPAGCPVSCRPSSFRRSPCSSCSTCPITCMKPCCLPTAFCLPSALNCAPRTSQVCASPPPTKYSSFSSNTCYVKSYSKSKGNDAFCKQLMAKYNITAPEPLAFCPIPREMCPPTCMPRKNQARSFSSTPTSGCRACGPTSCYNTCNNKPLPYTKNVECDILEDCSHSNNFLSPKKQNQGPIIYKTSPSDAQPRVEFRIPKRTSVECIKQTGPRSPCKEYMSTHTFRKEHKKDTCERESVTEEEQSAADDARGVESPQSSKGKAKKRKPSQRPKGESSEKSQKVEVAQNLSENQSVNDNSSALTVPTGFISWRMSTERVLTKSKSARSKSTESAKTSRAESPHKLNRSPVKMAIEGSGRVKRYSPCSKSFYPTFLKLSSESEPPTTSQEKDSTISPKFDNRRLKSSKSLFDESSATDMGFMTKFHDQPYVNSKPTFDRITNNYKYHPASELNGSRLSKSFETDFMRSKRKRCFSPPLFDNSPHIKNVVSSCQGITDTVTDSRMTLTPDHESMYLKNTSAVESESLTILPKVESITSLVEKYDRVEVSATGIMAQSKCKIFDYISVESSSAITASVKEDPSLSVIEELTIEQSSGADISLSPTVILQAEDSNTATPTNSIAAQDTDSEEMKKGVSKIEQAQGDTHDQREETKKKRPASKNVDAPSISDSMGDNLRTPLRNTKLETFAQKIGLCQGSYMSMIGESSVDPDEYGAIGESAVDPVGGHFKCETRNSPSLRKLPELNHSNNNNPSEGCELKVDTADTPITGPTIEQTTVSANGPSTTLPTTAVPASGPSITLLTNAMPTTLPTSGPTTATVPTSGPTTATVPTSGPTTAAAPTNGPTTAAAPTNGSTAAVLTTGPLTGPTAVPITAAEGDDSERLDVGVQGADESKISRMVEGKVKANLPSVELLQSSEIKRDVTRNASSDVPSEINHSNNGQSEPRIDSVEVCGQREGGMRGQCKDLDDEMNDSKSGESKVEAKTVSALNELLGSSGVKWAKVNQATEADIKLLRFSKAAYLRKRYIDPKTRSGQGSTGTDPHPDSDAKPYLNLLKPGEIESSELYSSTNELASDATMDQIRNFGTPV